MDDVITQRHRQCRQARAFRAASLAFETPDDDPAEALDDAAQMRRDDVIGDRSCYDELVSEHLSLDGNFLDALHRIATEPELQAQDVAEIREAITIAGTAMKREWLESEEAY